MSRKLNNRGYSLVELIVVVLIVAVLAGGTGISVAVVYNARVKKAAKLITSQLELCRQKTMAKEDKSGTSGVYLKLYTDDGVQYATVYDGASVVREETLGNDRIIIKAGPKNSSRASLSRLGDADVTYIYKFKKASGGIDPVYTSSEGGESFLDIYVEGNDIYHIMIAEYTGRCYMESLD